MKIGIVTPYYYPTFGGVQEHIWGFFQTLKKRGHQVKIIAPYYLGLKELGDDDVIRIGQAIPLKIYGTEAWITSPFGLSKKVKEVLKSYQFDFLHFHSLLEPFLNFLVLENSKAINIATFHTYAEKNIFCNIFKRNLKIYLEKLNGIICVSSTALSFLEKYFGRIKAEIIPNGIDLTNFKPGKKIKKYDDGKTNILFVGRNTERKGAKYLLTAFEIIRKEIKNIRLIIVGRGFIEKMKKEKLEKYQQKEIFFEGSIKSEDLPVYYSTASVFCSPAIYGESFGIVLLEAMACGVCIVASNIEGYNTTVVDGKDGLLAPPKNAEKLAEIIIKLLKDKILQEKLKTAALKKVKAYSWEEVTDKILCYYKSLKG